MNGRCWSCPSDLSLNLSLMSTTNFSSGERSNRRRDNRTTTPPPQHSSIAAQSQHHSTAPQQHNYSHSTAGTTTASQHHGSTAAPHTRHTKLRNPTSRPQPWLNKTPALCDRRERRGWTGMGGRDATERPTYWRRDNVTNHSPSEGAIFKRDNLKALDLQSL